MKVKVELDESCREPTVLIRTASMSEEVQEILKKLAHEEPKVLSGKRNDRIEILEENDVIRIYSSAGRVYAVTDSGTYTMHERLYELEERLDPKKFVRISSGDIINLKQADHFDCSMAGTILVRMKNGDIVSVSRRSVPRVRKILGM